MIRFEQFINSVHSAVQAANSALVQENLKLLEDYFEDSDETQEIKTSLDNALEAMEGVMDGGRQSQEAIEKAKQAFSNARDALQKENKQKGAAKQSSSLKAKTVALQFPDQSSEGTIMRNVHVPLISLIPISMAQVAEVKFRSNLELQVQDDELLVGFTAANGGDGKSQSDSTEGNGTYIEITIRPQESSEGLKKLIKGYDSMLRSQIPN